VADNFLNTPGGFGTEAGFGLNLSSKGDGNLGLGQTTASAPVPQSNINIPQAPAADPNRALKDALASGLIAFGANDATAGINAVTSAQQRRSQAEQLKKANMVKSLQLGSSLAASASSLPKEQRQSFITATMGTLTEAGDESTARLFQSLADRPDRQIALGGLEQTEIGKQLIQQDPTGASLTEFATTPQGQAALDQITDQTVTPGGFQKLSGITGSLDKLARDGHIDSVMLKRVQADGKISIPEFQELSESMPEGHPMKLAPAELAAITAERNIPTLRSAGISLAEDFEPEEVKLQGKDNIVDGEGNFVGIGIFDPKEGFKVQTESGIRPLKKGERTLETSGGLEDTGLTKKTTTDLQAKLLSSTGASDRLGETIRKFDSEFLTIGGKVKFGALALADKTGIPLSDELKDDLTAFTEFKSGALNDLNLYIKDITGAAMTVSEAERLRKTMPDPDNDSPTQFLSKLNKVYNDTLVVRQRAMLALDQGLDATSISLGDVQAQILDGTLPQKRFDSLINKGLSAADAATQIKAEFPPEMLKEAQQRKRKRRK
jgi:hypothetical protein